MRCSHSSLAQLIIYHQAQLIQLSSHSLGDALIWIVNLIRTNKTEIIYLPIRMTSNQLLKSIRNVVPQMYNRLNIKKRIAYESFFFFFCARYWINLLLIIDRKTAVQTITSSSCRLNFKNQIKLISILKCNLYAKTFWKDARAPDLSS